MGTNCRKIMRGTKKVISSAVLYFLYCGFYELSKSDSRIKAEVDSWEQGLTYCLTCGENCPSLTIRKGKNGLERVAHTENPDVMFAFKNLEKAFLVLTGRQGVANAYATHSFALRGDIAKGMSFARCVDLVERYLFPPIITNHILKENPRKQCSSIILYLKIIGGTIILKYKAVGADCNKKALSSN